LRTLSDFRKHHLTALSDLFVQVLRLCQAAGLIQFGHVAIDGRKLKANASRHKAMGYGRLRRAGADLAAEVAGWFARASRLMRRRMASRGPDAAATNHRIGSPIRRSAWLASARRG
jgi:hypothetical protein